MQNKCVCVCVLIGTNGLKYLKLVIKNAFVSLLAYSSFLLSEISALTFLIPVKLR